MARPTLLRKGELREKLLQAVRAGVSFEVAAVYAGVSRRVIHQWLQRGEKEHEQGRDTVYARFFHDAEQARATAQAGMVMDLHLLAKRDGRVMLNMLSRVDPVNWGKPGQQISKAQSAALAEAKVRQAEAEARLSEARAEALEKATEGGGGMVLLPQDFMGALPQQLQVAMQAWLAEQGLATVQVPSLGQGVTHEEAQRLSPSMLPAPSKENDDG